MCLKSKRLAIAIGFSYPEIIFSKIFNMHMAAVIWQSKAQAKMSAFNSAMKKVFMNNYTD